MDKEHRFAVFSSPPEVRDKLDYENIDKLIHAVADTLQAYFDKYGIDPNQPVYPGILIYPHTYGSKDLKWKPHINVMISGLGITKCTPELHRKVKNTRYDNCNWDNHKVQIKYIDYDKVRTIYKEKLEEEFDVDIGTEPQVEWDSRDKDNQLLSEFDNDKPGIEPQNLLNNFNLLCQQTSNFNQRYQGVKTLTQ